MITYTSLKYPHRRRYSIPIPQEVVFIRTIAPVRLTVYQPSTQDGIAELEKRCAEIHAAFVIRRVKAMNCPTWQKQALLDNVQDTVNSLRKLT